MAKHIGGADPLPSLYSATLNLNSDGTPTANSPVLYGGVNLTSLCTGLLKPLCSDLNGDPRPATGNWDAGAFQAVSTDTTPPTVPAGLTATDHIRHPDQSLLERIYGHCQRDWILYLQERHAGRDQYNNNL